MISFQDHDEENIHLVYINNIVLEEKPKMPQGEFKLEYRSPGRGYKLKSYELGKNVGEFGHVIWDEGVMGGGMQPFLETDGAMLLSHNTNSLEQATNWHYKAVEYLKQQDS